MTGTGVGSSRSVVGPTVAHHRLTIRSIPRTVESAGSAPTAHGGTSMDEQRFDEVVKHIATTSRRQILNGLLGGLAATVGMHGVGAARKRQKQQNSTKGRNKSDRKQEVRAAAKGKAKAS